MKHETLAKAQKLNEEILTIRSVVRNPHKWSISYSGMVLNDGTHGGHINPLHKKALDKCRIVLTEMFEVELAKLEQEFNQL